MGGGDRTCLRVECSRRPCSGGTGRPPGLARSGSGWSRWDGASEASWVPLAWPQHPESGAGLALILTCAPRGSRVSASCGPRIVRPHRAGKPPAAFHRHGGSSSWRFASHSPAEFIRRTRTACVPPASGSPCSLGRSSQEYNSPEDIFGWKKAGAAQEPPAVAPPELPSGGPPPSPGALPAPPRESRPWRRCPAPTSASPGQQHVDGI